MRCNGAWSASACSCVVNLLQRLRLADRPAFEVITRSPALLLCIGVGALQMMINYGTMGFTPSFLMKHYGLSPATTGLQFGLLAAAIGIIGPLIAGPLSDRINARFPGAGRAWVTLVVAGGLAADRALGLPRARILAASMRASCSTAWC